ncbi:hypothetical protein [Phenylobacterium sp.]|jgi:hypothetical protein|uniref:hypothetical protein n=1 Tax=Phenylobacterium sp. TaxID=1871053 RepID=UPI001203FBFC|nr:hypothetical protein [Phenylobacterium sp.]THD63303.1 MAG: hypothetical protein E8A12_08810 [Phenylobacterium sp.]
MEYNYFELRLKRDRTAQKALGDHVRQTLGAKAVAVFAPLLGFASNQALVLTTGDAAVDAVMRAPGVVSAERHRLTPTIRPADGAKPAAMGVYVHNWFTIDATGFDEFVKLSGEAWPDFEGHFETKIFGLFAAQPSKDDLMEGARRLLLMTGYRDLGEWQKSRNPAETARNAFARRRDLTRVSLARSCVLAPAS